MLVQSPTVAVKTLVIDGSIDQGNTFVYNADVCMILSTYGIGGLTPPPNEVLIQRLAGGNLVWVNENVQVVPVPYKAVPA